LKAKDIELNRKTLAHMAVHDPEGFAAVVDSVK
jgi:ribosomal protein L20